MGNKGKKNILHTKDIQLIFETLELVNNKKKLEPHLFFSQKKIVDTNLKIECEMKKNSRLKSLEGKRYQRQS